MSVVMNVESGFNAPSFNAPSFNARVEVTELLTKTLENVSKDLASRCIKECGLKYGFDAEEAIRDLGLENLSLLKKKMSRKSVSVPKEKKAKEAKKAVFPLPFASELVNELGCQGLAFNRGLFTQCLKSRMENGGFCKGCQSEADKNASGCPDCGTVETRLNTGLYDFKDPKGRSPVSYLKVLTKLKLTEEQAIEEAVKMGLEIPAEHLVVIEKAKKSPISRGRPKKVGGAVEAENVNDLFKKLSLDSDEESIEETIEETIEEQEEIAEKPVAAKKTKLSEEEKAAKKEALEKERQAKKEEREAQRKAEAEQKKLEREAKLAAEREAKKAKIEAEKKERQEKREAEKAAKAAEKPKKSKKAEAEPVAPQEPVAPAPVPVPVTVTVPVEEPAKAKTTVTRIQISGKPYLKSSANILYDPNTKEEVGLWNPITKKIEELPEEEEEEEEEEEYV
jgi:hypothetical protein